MKKIMKEKNQIVVDEVLNKEFMPVQDRIQIKKKLTTESCFDSHKILHNALYSVEMQRFCVCSNLNLRRF